MAKEALVSVVIPAYNAELYLERTLCSALEQTYPQIEILVVDDGSRDSTNEIASWYAAEHKNLSVLKVPNGGVASARNVGLHAARGEYVAFLDADDLWHPTKIERQVHALSAPAGAEAAAVYGRMRIIDEEDCVIRNGSGVGVSGNCFARHAYTRPVGNGSSLLVRREVAEEVGGFDPGWLHRGVGGCEDLDFELKIAAKYPILALPEFLVGYRSHPDNMSSDRLTLARSLLATVDHHLALHPSLPEWATRKIRASAIEGALQLLALDGQWRLFMEQLLRLRAMDAGRAVAYTTRFVLRKLVRDILHIQKRSHNFQVRPAFLDLEPGDGAGSPVRFRSAKYRKAVAELSLLDARWNEQNGYK